MNRVHISYKRINSVVFMFSISMCLLQHYNDPLDTVNSYTQIASKL